MTNREKFKSEFGLYATEVWAMPEKDFLEWLNAKAIDAEPVKHGHWVYDEKPMIGNPYGSYICSRCFPYAQPHKTHYCSNCGAKMDEVEE